MEHFQILAQYPAIAYSLAVVFGLMIGSFLNVVIYRLPLILEQDWKLQCQELLGIDQKEKKTKPFNLAQPGSHCPKCGQAITPLQNIPVLSYLLQKGRCRHCKVHISLRYPLVELLTAMLTVLVLSQLGITIEAVLGILIVWALIVLTFIDIDHQLLPDDITLPLLWSGLLAHVIWPDIYGVSLKSAVIGAISGYLILWIVYQAFRLLTGKEGMGFGDFKLLAVFGAWLGWQMLPLVILVSSAIGAITGIIVLLTLGKDKNTPLPFGPYLCIAGLIALLWGQQLTNAYLQIAGFQ